MYTRLIYLISFVFVLSLVGNVSADVSWNDSTGDHLWSTPANWATGAVPTPADGYVRIGMLPGPTITNEGAVAQGIHLGIGTNAGALTVDGGTLTVEGGAFNLGYTGSGTLNMTSGTITLTNILKVARDPTAVGHVNLDGGIISTNNFSMREKDGAVGTMDIGAGTLIINGDRLSLVQGYIDNGWITAYDGNGTLQLDYDVTNEGQTTVKAIHKLNPNPADGGSAAPGAITLEWTVDAGTPVDVWFTTKANPDEWTEEDRIVDKQAVTSLNVTTVAKQRYFWAVDTYAPGAEDPNYGPIFSFLADNAPPVVDAGEDVTSWLDNGSVDVALAGTVTDTDPTTTVWTVVSEPDDPNSPDAVIADAAAVNTSITLSALGEYVLQLQADDGEYTGSDTVTINVYSDSCEAAQSLPDYVPLAGDVNADCVVDARDFALIAANWLDNNAL